METLVNFLKANEISSLITNESVIRSSYLSHYRDGDSDDTVEGFPCVAAIAETTTVNNVAYICYKTSSTDPEARGWCGNRKSSYWITVEDATKIMANTSSNLLALIRCNLPKELANLPINWDKELAFCRYRNGSGQFASGINYSVAYYKDQIQIEEEAWTCYIQQSSKSSTQVVGQWNINTGENTTASLIAYKKKVYFNEKMTILKEKGLTKKQAIAFMSTKISWKWEIVNDLSYILSQTHLPKDLFTRLSQCNSNEAYDKLCDNWQIDMFNEKTLPRKTSYAALIAALK